MKLELKKFRIVSNIRGAVIACLAILGFILLAGTAPDKGNAFFQDYSYIMDMIETLVRDVFIIFASVLIAEFVIGEYKSKTVTVLFTYPISRKRIIAAKLIIIGVFTLVCIILSNTFINLVFYAANNAWGLIPARPTARILYTQAVKTFVNALAATGISFIPLLFGMIKKSTSATIVSAVIVVAIAGSNSNGFSMFSIIIIPISLAAVGLGGAWLSIRNINRRDVV
jgi:ABC-type transport system involved in multi-copper enzyme maturation permease subunit